MIIDKEFYTSHIYNEEKLIKMRRILDKIEIVLNRHIVETTDFLDPYEVYLAQSILNRFTDLNYKIAGGYENAERRIIIIYPDYYDSHQLPAGIGALKISNSNEDLSHKDYLGSILSLGIIRDKIGDIIVHKDYAFIIVKEEIEDFIFYNLEKVANKNISLEPLDLASIVEGKSDYKEVTVFLKSLRLDSAISAVYNLSRKDSMKIIKGNNVKLNWEPIDKGSCEIKEKDVISVRRYGRAILHDISGYSKSGRIRCTFRILV